MTVYSAYWIGQIARRYNEHGVEGVQDRRHHPRTGIPLLKERLRPLLRQVATAFPHSSVELWAVDDHRIALRYLIGFVLPASGRSIFHVATSVSLALCETELAAFACAAGASPAKQIVLVLDRAGWHTSLRLRVPEHVHLLFLPPYSPELQPAEHLCPLANTVLINQHFATIEDLEEVQLARCAALQQQPAIIRSTS